MDYTPDDLKTELAAQEPGEETCVAYGLYALLFPPGEPDQGARNAAVAFATANGCTISNRKDDNFVCFRKAGQMKWATTGFRASLPRPVPSRKSPAEAGPSKIAIAHSLSGVLVITLHYFSVGSGRVLMM
jgi:hypothetical protein